MSTQTTSKVLDNDMELVHERFNDEQNFISTLEHRYGIVAYIVDESELLIDYQIVGESTDKDYTFYYCKGHVGIIVTEVSIADIDINS